MKIQSRKELGLKKPGQYKDHQNTTAQQGHQSFGLRVEAAFIPTSYELPDAKPVFYLVFGIDGRRMVLEMGHTEALDLKEGLDFYLGQVKPHLVK